MQVCSCLWAAVAVKEKVGKDGLAPVESGIHRWIWRWDTYLQEGQGTRCRCYDALRGALGRVANCNWPMARKRSGLGAKNAPVVTITLVSTLLGSSMMAASLVAFNQYSRKYS